MKQLIGRNIWMAVLLLAVAGAGVTPAAAQEGVGERITILVPNLAPRDGASDKFGEKVAEELRDLIDDLHTHQTVSDKELKNARKKYDLSEEDLHECIRARQLAMQMGWGLVVCGEYAPAGNRQVNVTASFVGAQNGETFDVPPFAANERNEDQAAQQILQTFDRYQTQLRHTVFCQQYMDSQQWESALDNCDQALAINPNSESALYKKGFTLWKMERREEALEALGQVLEIDPIDQDALKLAGIVATELGNIEVARGYFDRYMELNPGDVGVRLTLATDISNAGDPEAALRFAQAGLEIEPDNMNLVTYIGHFAANAAAAAEKQMQGGVPGEAETVAVDPSKITEFYSVAAEMYERVFNEEGTETDPTILEKLIIAKFKLGDIEEAVALGQRATTAKPDNAGIWEAYSRALEEAGRTQEALAAIEKAEAAGSASPALTQRKAMIQLAAGRTAAGVAALQAAVQSGQLDPAGAFAIIFRHAYQDKFQKGQLDAAYKLLDEAGALAVNEEDRLTRNFWRGYILYQQGQKVHQPMTAESARRAKPIFERALELFQAARGYEKIHASADVPKLIDATQRFIEIEDALIKRGR